MKSNKNCGNSKTAGRKSSCGGKTSSKSKKSAQESESDPSRSYTGNPVGWGKDAVPVQDADDL